MHWRRKWKPTPVFLSGESQGQRSLVGCRPWGHEESETTERLHFHFSLSCTGEGNGNPLQCSCLENPRDRGAWWAAIYRVTQSRTRLKRLSSSSVQIEGLDKGKTTGRGQTEGKASRWVYVVVGTCEVLYHLLLFSRSEKSWRKRD